MQNRARIYIVVLFLIAFQPSIQAISQKVSTSSAHDSSPWQWSDQDRIAARLNDAAAALRVRAHRASGAAEGAGAAGSIEAYDVIVGNHDSHLFLPFEIFDNLISLAFADDPNARAAYRESKEDQRKELGLPGDMWEQLESIVAPYRAGRRQERHLAFSNPTAEVRTEQQTNARMLCRDRLAALGEAQTTFGPAFKRFLYVAIAPTMTQVVLRKPDSNFVKVANGECE